MKSVLFGAALVVCATAAAAQRSAPAGASDRLHQSPMDAPRTDSTMTPLRMHVERGAMIGGISGLVSSGIILGLMSRTGGCYTAPGFGGGGCSQGVTSRKAAQIAVGGVVVGTLVGAVLGYAYHTNVEDQRRARCRLAPDSCK